MDGRAKNSRAKYGHSIQKSERPQLSGQTAPVRMFTTVFLVMLMSTASLVVCYILVVGGKSATRLSRTFAQIDESGRSKTAQLVHQSIGPTGANSPKAHNNETTLQLHDTDSKKTSPALVATDIKKPPPAQIDTDGDDVDADALYERLVIVTAVSDNHVKEVMGMIKSAQTHMPHKQIYVYNLGLNSKNIKKDTLAEFGTIFYGDASVRFKGPLSKIMPYLFLHHGFMAHLFGFDPKVPGEIQHYYYMTHAGMFEEMGLNKKDFYHATNSDAPYFSSGRLLLANNSVIWEKLLNPALECALKLQCIAPVGSNRVTHHYDQSLVGIVMYKNMRHEWTNETDNTQEFDKIVEINRSNTDGGRVKIC